MESSRQHNGPDTSKAGEQRDASPVSINSRHFAAVTRGEIFVQRFDDGRRTCAIEQGSGKVTRPILSLSPPTSSFLAISRNASVDIYDIDAQRVKATLIGSRRCITALCWSPCGSYLASGSIDGSLYIWALTRPSRPVAQCVIKTGLIQHVAWSKQSGAVIAVVNDSGLYIWDKAYTTQCVVSFARKADRLKHLSWSPHHESILLATSSEGRLCVWDLTPVVEQLRLAKIPTQPSPVTHSLVSQKKLFRSVLYVRWISEQAVALLYEAGKTFAVVDVRSPSFGSIDWELGFSHPFEAFGFEGDGERTHVRMVSREKQRTYPLPGRRTNVEAVSRPVSGESTGGDSVSCSSTLTRTMTAVPISKLREINRTRCVQASQHQENRIASLSDSLSTLRPESSTTHLPTPSSSRPRLAREESDSPMPFLSPAIPAKRTAHRADNVLNMDSIALPDSHSDGYFGSFSSATAHDSDSDDDAFDLKSSKDNTRLMPGGVNVPLPRSCGAVFTTNGNIVMFRPPQIKAVPDKDTSVSEQIDASHGDMEQTARLFPTFGNLFAAMAHFATVPGVVSTYESIEHRNMVVEALGLDKASYNSRGS
ncbi:hypothetical protein AMS68_006196 [Peltaster fructicola]|uniref:Uncharacterized protein n=1 Tax=Peltaster fructicola TaxID=286661 RepID=A0A6H0Y1E0_9PEZI|nr:hypothetical protein AMS68_006196 [Peltaster fructicola]